MKWNERKRKLRSFVDGLTDRQAREQLYLAYLQMEKCQQVLEGKDVEPVEMMENGLDSDLELFYMCKKAFMERTAGEVEYDTTMLVGPDCFVPVKVIEKRRDGRFREVSLTQPDIIFKLVK